MARDLLLLLNSEHRHLEAAAMRCVNGRGGPDKLRAEFGLQFQAHVSAMSAAAKAMSVTLTGSGLLELNEELQTLIVDGDPMRNKELLDAHERLESQMVAEALNTADVAIRREWGSIYLRTRDQQRTALGRAIPKTPRSLDLTTAALYDEARRAGISGRSGMSRQQLIDALTSARTFKRESA